MAKVQWNIIDTGRKSADANMRFDADLLERAEEFAGPVLHLYDWDAPSATFGHFIDPCQFLNLDRAGQKGLQLARRPTGGGILFHIWDMAFSVLVPAHVPEFSLNTLENYAFVNQAVLHAVREFLNIPLTPVLLTREDSIPLEASYSRFCMAKPTKYDVILQGKKVAGAAQRKTKKGFLHQGSISLQLPSQEYLEEILLPGTSVAEAMQRVTCPLLPQDASADHLSEAKEQLRILLATHLNAASLNLLKNVPIDLE
jgi:lipoate---protein ligase